MSGLALPLAFFEAPAWAKLFSSDANGNWTIGPFGFAAGVGIFAAVALAVLFALLQTVLPKVAAIAWTTAKEAVLQPLFYILLGAGVFFC